MVKKLLLIAGLIPVLGWATSAEASNYCREYTEQVNIGGRIQEAYGTACMQPDGSWEKQRGTERLISDNSYVQQPVQAATYVQPVTTYSQVIVQERPYYYPRTYHHYPSRPTFSFGFNWIDDDYRGVRVYDRQPWYHYKHRDKHWKRDNRHHGHNERHGGKGRYHH